MKILIISHNVFSETDSMGKTLLSYFSMFSSDSIAQLYIHSEIPTTSKCEDYYRITDKDMINSLFGFAAGKKFGKRDIDSTRVFSRTDQGLEALIYQKGRNRTPLIYFLRNSLWKIGRWKTKKLLIWLDSIKPDCVFFASGDYAFMYDIALEIASYRNIPLYVSCMDDYYLNNKNENKIGGVAQHRYFMKRVMRTISYSSKLFCICEKMSADYSNLFDKECITIHTSSSYSEPLHGNRANRIVYIGNLGHGRNENIVDIGRSLTEIDGDVKLVDVYSSESRPEVIGNLTRENGVIFHGSISADEVKSIIAECLAVIHTESFDSNHQNSVRYSVSTKIADILVSGTCIFAYGPIAVASMEYLCSNGVAVCATDKNMLKDKLINLMENKDLRKKTIKNALELARLNHSSESNYSILMRIFNNDAQFGR